MPMTPIIMLILLLLPAAGQAGGEFDYLATTPYPAQHVNPRNSDYTPFTSPTRLRLKWKALEDSTVVQGCTTAKGMLYCALAWNKESGKCNLVALSEVDGSRVWEDRIDGECLLDEHAALTNPTIDSAGNLYINDSEKIVSFTAAGKLRWINNTPATLVSRKGLSNAPFGLALLPDGQLATATVGDAWIFFLDSQTGAVTKQPFDLPAEKRKLEKTSPLLMPNQRPDNFMENLASRTGSKLLWDFALGESDFETDNNIAVDVRHHLLFISSGAPYPNKNNSGALWAVSYAGENLEVAFYVPLDTPGGIATTPTLSSDQKVVLIGDNDQNLVTVNVEKCLRLPSNSACDAYQLHPMATDLTSSVILTDSNRLILPTGRSHYAAFDLSISENGETAITPAWKTRLSWLPLAVSVHLAFDNVVWIPAYNIVTQQSFIVALDVDSGAQVARYDSGDAANVTMASDGKTMVANIMSFIESLFLGRMGFDVQGGVWAWEPAY